MNAFKRISEVLQGTSEMGVELETLSESLEQVEDFVADSNIPHAELYLIMDRMEKLGKEIRNEIKDVAGLELELLFDDSKQSFLGNAVTLSKIKTWDYPTNKQIDNYTKKIKSTENKIAPDLKKIKDYNDGIKSVQEQMRIDGTAKISNESYRISISKS